MNVTVTTSKIWNGGEITRDMYAEMQQTMLNEAERIAATARQLVRVGKGVPRHLRDTIRAKAKRKETGLERLVHGITSGDYEVALPGAWVFAGDRAHKKDQAVYWAHWVEYGTYDSPARPYMRPAVEANFSYMEAAILGAGRRVINKKRRARAKERRLAEGKSR